jgi:hypothetical protein
MAMGSGLKIEEQKTASGVPMGKGVLAMRGFEEHAVVAIGRGMLSRSLRDLRANYAYTFSLSSQCNSVVDGVVRSLCKKDKVRGFKMVKEQRQLFWQPDDGGATLYFDWWENGIPAIVNDLAWDGWGTTEQRYKSRALNKNNCEIVPSFSTGDHGDLELVGVDLISATAIEAGSWLGVTYGYSWWSEDKHRFRNECFNRLLPENREFHARAIDREYGTKHFRSGSTSKPCMGLKVRKGAQVLKDTRKSGEEFQIFLCTPCFNERYPSKRRRTALAVETRMQKKIKKSTDCWPLMAPTKAFQKKSSARGSCPPHDTQPHHEKRMQAEPDLSVPG